MELLRRNTCIDRLWDYSQGHVVASQHAAAINAGRLAPRRGCGPIREPHPDRVCVPPPANTGVTVDHAP
eukprot:SAG25_NODE_137_length_14197_cov_30.387120_17_plen_69_part_00